MIGDNQPIQGPGEPYRLPGGGDDFLAAREFVGLARGEAVSKEPGIHREAGMKVGVTPERPLREGSMRVRRV